MWPRFLIDHMFLGKIHWHLKSEWTFGLVNALNHHWCETCYYNTTSSCFEPGILFSRILCVEPVLYILKKSMWHCFISDIFSMLFYITFKMKTLACGSQVGHLWITSGLLYGSVGQCLSGSSRSTSVTHFQLWYVHSA